MPLFRPEDQLWRQRFRRWRQILWPSSTACEEAGAEDSLSVLAGDAKDVLAGKAVSAPERWEHFTQGPQDVIRPQVFDGFRGIYIRQNTPLFAFSHQLLLGSSEMPTMYQFGAIMGVDVTTGSHIRADMDHGGSLSVGGVLMPDPSLAIRPSLHLVQAADGKRMDQVGAECVYTGSTFVGETGIKCGVHENSIAVRYLQAITPSVVMGVSSTFRDSGNASLEGVARMTTAGHSQVQALLKPSSVDLAYVRDVVQDRISVGTELNISRNNIMEPYWRVGGQFRFKQSTVSTSVDNSGGVQTLVELKPKQIFQIQLSANVNTWKDSYKFGVAFMLNL